MTNRNWMGWMTALAVAATSVACGPPPADESRAPLTATFDSAGGLLAAAADSPFAGLALEVSPGAFEEPVQITLQQVFDETELPADAVAVGDQFELVWIGGRPADWPTLSLPFDTGRVSDAGKDWMHVEVWTRAAGGWQRLEPAVRSERAVAIRVQDGGVFFAGIKLE